MKKKTFQTNNLTQNNNTIFHLSSYEVTKSKKEYIIPANRSVKYSKLEKAQRKENERLKKELKDYTKYDQ